MTKLTKRDYLTRILAYAHEEDKDFLRHEIDLLDRKNAKRAETPTKRSAESMALADAIYREMDEGVGYAVSTMCATFVSCAGLNPQKVSAAVKKLKDSGRVTRAELKSKAYFYKV